MADNIRIVKVGGKAAPPPSVAPKPSAPKHKKSMKTYPRGVLRRGGKTERVKIDAVRDPAKPPPSRKSTLRILTKAGAEKRRERIRETIRHMPNDKIKHKLKAAGIPVSDKAPEELKKEILASGMEAGMISVD